MDINTFAEAGKSREVSLDTLLSMFDSKFTTSVGNGVRKHALCVNVGIAPNEPGDTVLACVAAYMGWLDQREEKSS